MSESDLESGLQVEGGACLREFGQSLERLGEHRQVADLQLCQPLVALANRDERGGDVQALLSVGELVLCEMVGSQS